MKKFTNVNTKMKKSGLGGSLLILKSTVNVNRIDRLYKCNLWLIQVSFIKVELQVFIILH